jgi:hypothetical protein
MLAVLFLCSIALAQGAEPTVKTWGKPELVETDNTGDALSPLIAFDSEGNALSIWSQSSGGFLNLLANRYIEGKGWGKPELLETSDFGNAFFPRLLADTKGNAFAIWQQGDDIPWQKRYTQINIWTNHYVAGKGWGKAEYREAEKIGLSRFPHIAFDKAGNAIATWERTDGTRFKIWASRYTPNGGWEKAQLIEHNDIGHGDAYWPWVAFDPSGNAFVMWHQTDGKRFNVWAVHYTPSGGWEKPELMEHDDLGDALYPRMVFDSKGNGIAVWQQQGSTRVHIQAKRYDATKGWEKPEILENVTQPTNGLQAQIAFDSQDNAIAVWEQSNGGKANVLANRYIAGKGWGKSERISIDNGGSVILPKIVIDSQGNAFSIWHQSDGNVFNIWAARYTLGKGWNTPELLEHDDSWHAANPEIAIDKNGNAIAVWQQSDSKQRFSIWANRFK